MSGVRVAGTEVRGGSSRRQRQDSALTPTEPLQGSGLRGTEFDPSSNRITLAAAPRRDAGGSREK